MRPQRLSLVLIACIAGPLSLAGQDIPMAWGQPWGVGARAAGMAGAMTAVADDPSALHYNPAGLGLAEHTVLTGTFSHLMRTNTADLEGQKVQIDPSFTRLNEFGLSMPVPTARGSLVFALAYQRVRQFDDETNMQISDPLAAGLLWNHDRIEEGFLSRTSAGVSVEMAPGLFLGGGLAIWGGNNDYTWRFQESDVSDQYTFLDSTSTEHIGTDYSGVQLNVGVLIKAGNLARLGLVLESPFTLKGSERWDYRDTFSWDADQAAEPAIYADAGTDEYRVRVPTVMRGGLAVTGGPVTVSVEGELMNYREFEYNSDPPGGGMSRTEANMQIRDNFRNVLNTRLGVEYALPLAGARLRAGWASLPSHRKNAESDENRKVLSFGAGFRLQDRLSLDLSLARTEWTSAGYSLFYESDLGSYGGVIGEKKEASQFMVSFVYGL